MSGRIKKFVARKLAPYFRRSADELESVARENPSVKSEWLRLPVIARPNPSLRDEVKRGAKLGQEFSGHRYNRAAILRRPKPSGVRVAIGPVTGIMYLARRDGRVEQYLHRFAKKSRPLLATTSDGSKLELLGGAFRFTDRGIVDAQVRVRPRRKRS